jgi:nicotinamide phosphoribosyltransferase
VRIKAVPEGTVVPVHQVLATIENTDPKCWWLTNYLETLLVEVWYPTTVATLSREMKRLIGGYMDRTAGHREGLEFKLHDFGFRGVSSPESAGLGGAAHLLNFRGTDTLAALTTLRDYYAEPMAGFSIPAAEHSTITAWGRGRERDAYANMLDQFPTGLVAVVSDSYDVFHACEHIWGEELRDRVLTRDGTVVIRPDSGDPPTVVVKVLDVLGEKLGCGTNALGFKVLDPHVRLIQGDGVNYDSTRETLANMERHGWSTENVAFGMGGALLQKLHRDTQAFAFKCSWAEVNGRGFEVSKNPVTDTAKHSKPGRMKLVRTSDGFETMPEDAPGEDVLVEVFRDGKVTREWTLAECRARVEAT